MNPQQQQVVRLSRIKPRVAGAFLLQQRGELYPKLVIITKDDNEKLWVDLQQPNTKPQRLDIITSGSKWSLPLNFTPKGNSL